MYLLAMFFHNGVQELKLLVNVILRDHGGFAGVGAGVVMNHSVLRFVFPSFSKLYHLKLSGISNSFSLPGVANLQQPRVATNAAKHNIINLFKTL